VIVILCNGFIGTARDCHLYIHKPCSDYASPSGVEFSGRSCAGINEINFKSMAEAVSTDHKQLSFDSAFCQVELLKEKMIEVVSARYFSLLTCNPKHDPAIPT